MTFHRSGWTGAALLGLALTPAFAAETKYTADLDPAPMTLATRADLTGEGTVTADLNGNKLTVSGNFSGLALSAGDAHLQAAPVGGMPGPAFADLTITQATSGTITGSATLTRAQAASLRNGGLYVQINTAKSKPPYGTLWGFFLPSGQ